MLSVIRFDCENFVNNGEVLAELDKLEVNIAETIYLSYTRHAY